MSATVCICQRNGPMPGIITENVPIISWESVDNSYTSYISYNAAINLGMNSFTKYIYIRFSGSFTTIGNVVVTHCSGKLLKGCKLMSSPSIIYSSEVLQYQIPKVNIDFRLTQDISLVNSSINLLVGPSNDIDPASAPNKGITTNNTGAVYTNYFITQLQTNLTGNIGVNDIAFQISYDEI